MAATVAVTACDDKSCHVESLRKNKSEITSETGCVYVYMIHGKVALSRPHTKHFHRYYSSNDCSSLIKFNRIQFLFNTLTLPFLSFSTFFSIFLYFIGFCFLSLLMTRSTMRTFHRYSSSQTDSIEISVRSTPERYSFSSQIRKILNNLV